MFLDNWKPKRPMLLQINHISSGWDINLYRDEYLDLLEKCEAVGLIKEYQSNSIYLVKQSQKATNLIFN